MNNTLKRFERLTRVIAQSGDPDTPFWYLGGPMTGIPQFNFPRFTEVAAKLRAAGYNIVTPHELDDKETEKAALASADGAPGTGSANGEKWEDFLSRDVVIVSLPTCQGGFFMEGWHRSSGAQLESYLIDRLKKEVYEYDDTTGEILLTLVDRDERLRELELEDMVQRNHAVHELRPLNGARPNRLGPDKLHDPFGDSR